MLPCADNPCREGGKWCGKYDTQQQANTHWKLYHDPKTSSTQTYCGLCDRRFLREKTFNKHKCENRKFKLSTY